MDAKEMAEKRRKMENLRRKRKEEKKRKLLKSLLNGLLGTLWWFPNCHLYIFSSKELVRMLANLLSGSSFCNFFFAGLRDQRRNKRKQMKGKI